MAAPVANARVSLASWKALKCGGQLVGSNNGILNGLTGAQLERIEEHRKLALQKREEGLQDHLIVAEP